ncbi:MAG TPA: addiction module protein [Balneolaceae bacterium]|nr:addiction module protein [Balneolaceae bacterium]
MIKPEEIKNLTLQEKLLLMEVLWEDLSGVEDQLEISDWHKEILDDREEKIRAGEARFIDWETAKKEIRDATS